MLDILAEQGIAALSVRSVASAAGVSPAQVQYYFRTKSELVRAGFDHAGQQFEADLERAAPTTLLELVEQWLPLDARRERRARVWLAYAAASVADSDLAAESAKLDEELRQRFVALGLNEQRAAQLFALVDGVTLQSLVLPMAERRALADRSIVPWLTALSQQPVS